MNFLGGLCTLCVLCLPRCIRQLAEKTDGKSSQIKLQKKMVRQRGFEPLTHSLEGCCSILLSYWRTCKKNCRIGSKKW
jgi:hypothetical protein